MIAKRLLKLIASVFVVVIIGTIGYTVIEGWNMVDSLYMTVITLSTVGFQEVRPLSGGGRFFTIFLVFLGITTLAVWMAMVTSFLVEYDIKGIFLRRRLMKKIGNMKNHTILCGEGRTGQTVIEEFIEYKIPLVVIEQAPNTIAHLQKIFPELLIVEGSATDEEILLEAHILEARSLIATLSSDVDNLFVVITSKDLKENLTIVARAFDESIVPRMQKAGAHEVVSLNKIGGHKIASFILNRNLTL